jgi:hypothetical protein
MAAFTVATLFYSYRAYFDALRARHRKLRARVAYMLWVAANAAGE